MPRRSGTITVWRRASCAASGPHMSPVSPKPWIRTTAGPAPPLRTWMVAPSAVCTVLVLNCAGSAGSAACASSVRKKSATALIYEVFTGAPEVVGMQSQTPRHERSSGTRQDQEQYQAASLRSMPAIASSTAASAQ